MDPPNPEWDFLKDLFGEKPSWKQQKDKHRVPGWAEPRGLVSTVGEELHILEVRTASWSKALA